MKDLDRRLLVELMKNCRRSDRELARSLDVSQPTVTRAIHRLEENGYIKEYTIIPDFSKLGYEILSFGFGKMKGDYNDKKQEQVQAFVNKFQKEHIHAELIGARGIGMSKQVAFVSFFENYADYWKTQRLAREVPYSDVFEFENFLVDLKGQTLLKPLSMSSIAKHVLTAGKQKTRHDDQRQKQT